MAIKILNYSIRILYGGLMVVASIAALLTGAISAMPIVMFVGGLLLLFTVFKKANKSAILLLALILIHVAAIWSGINSTFHLSHHVIRLSISVLIFVLHWQTVKNVNID